ncbi:MAG: hypothetical protein A3G18_03245 [Rhodospirillales bacterium RIFCSPLOWO2_12_FULL_58_28]|nr:MAG: hypothetical protein A3H92_03190 [Rhodospirillales bacterium RIFCSPLOWO2_02_FULL_58_16]OHC77293.1 MAG: hypothetical protein A3G18_03245 [Rhodospirillales bacterium RIFCSPLOWO2_12_FULL_58_28]
MKNPEQKKSPSARRDDDELQAAAKEAFAEESASPTTDEPGPDSVPVVDDASSPVKKSRGVSGVLIMVAASAVVGAAGYLTWPRWSPIIASYLPDPRVDGVDNRLKTLEEQTKVRLDTDQEIKGMEAERTRLRGQVEALIQQVDSLDQAFRSVRKVAEATALSAETADAEASLKQLSQRFAKLEERDEAMGGLLDRIGKLEQERLIAKGDSSSGENDIAEISKRIGALEAAKDTAPPSALPAGSQAVLLAVNRLHDDLRGAAPYAESLEALKAAAEGDQGVMTVISVLDPLAAVGIPTQAALRDRFDAMAVKVANSFMAVEGDGWVAKTITRLTSLVSVRRIGADAGAADAALAAAETGLKSGDLPAAVKALENLAGSQAVIAEPWLKDARARLTAERAMTTLHVLAASPLSPAKE